jgi:hypothetical protein
MLRTLLFALLFSTPLMGAEIANYRFGIEKHTANEFNAHVMTVSIDEDALMTVTLNKSSREDSIFFTANGDAEVFQKDLNAFTFKSLKLDIIRLANAPITKSYSEVVCMMMPGPAQSNDHLSVRRVYDRGQKKFWGDMELVFGPRGCWIAFKVSPEAQIDKEVANNLKAQVRALALDLVGSHL